FETAGAPSSAPNSLSFVISIGGVFRTLTTFVGNQLTIGFWQHVAATYDGATMRIYRNGVLVAIRAETGAIDAVTDPIVIGRNAVDTSLAWHGGIDELSLYNRSLSESEIVAIHAAGTAGKCKPTATVAPSGQVAWFSGDGNANDISGNNNNGTLQNGAGLAIGKVGQGFRFDGVDDNVGITSNGFFTNQPGGTIEAWVNPQGSHGDGNGSVFYEDIGTSGFTRFGVSVFNDGTVAVGGRDSTGIVRVRFTDSGAAPLNSWTHVIGVWEVGVGIKVYVNGVLSASLDDATLTNFSAINAQAVRIGNLESGGNSFNEFNGLLDEITLYNRILSSGEVQSIFNAGVAGKLKTASTPVGFAALSEPEALATGFERKTFYARERPTLQSPEVVNTTIGDATITFPTVTTAGTTQQIPLATILFPALPFGTHTGLAYDMATTSVFTGNASVCFNLPAFTTTQFANLRVMHFEAGNWVNVTAAANIFPNLCTTGLTSLSPFAIAQLGPTAASVSVSGRVNTAAGRGISKAIVLLEDSNGNARSALTSTFGYYRFENVEAGETYILNVRSKRYQFADPTRVISVFDNLTDVDFTASP
ncbi:MAG: LamG domain-containing protein, partial [Pyrinomonadaceae bacterium]